MIDGKDISKVNIQQLRSQIGVVSQEPRLTDGTILENIKYGKVMQKSLFYVLFQSELSASSTMQTDATLEEVVRAAKKANVHDTIMKFPQQYQTQVGVRGSKLSGGQKQRIAIAR